MTESSVSATALSERVREKFKSTKATMLLYVENGISAVQWAREAYEREWKLFAARDDITPDVKEYVAEKHASIGRLLDEAAVRSQKHKAEWEAAELHSFLPMHSALSDDEICARLDAKVNSARRTGEEFARVMQPYKTRDVMHID